ncbi:MAG: hypothetical protein LBO66_08560 [Deltaproteobacteria bacterium]|nr:hypothetical protein [Deltaproteobacteria bacterium]
MDGDAPQVLERDDPFREPLFPYALKVAGRLPGVLESLAQGAFLLLEAPRLAGKTMALKDLARELSASPANLAVYVPLRALGGESDPAAAVAATASLVAESLAAFPGAAPPDPGPYARRRGLADYLPKVLETGERRLALFLDDIDSPPAPAREALVGEIFLALARAQEGGRRLSALFSARLGFAETRAGGAPDAFARSPLASARLISLPPWGPDDLKLLLDGPFAKRAISFSPEAAEELLYFSGGSPGLTVKLVSRALESLPPGFQGELGADRVDRASRLLILERRGNFLGPLLHPLADARVQRVMEAVLLGDGALPAAATMEDVGLCLGLGLLSDKDSTLAPTCPLTREAILSALAHRFALALPRDLEIPFRAGKRLDMGVLLLNFQAFFLETVKVPPSSPDYSPSHGPLALAAYLQKALGEEGTLLSEYGLGRRRLDLLLTREGRNYPVFTRVAAQGPHSPTLLKNLAARLDRLRATEGWLVYFNPVGSGSSPKPPFAAEKIEGRTIYWLEC